MPANQNAWNAEVTVIASGMMQREEILSPDPVWTNVVPMVLGILTFIYLLFSFGGHTLQCTGVMMLRNHSCQYLGSNPWGWISNHGWLDARQGKHPGLCAVLASCFFGLVGLLFIFVLWAIPVCAQDLDSLCARQVPSWMYYAQAPVGLFFRLNPAPCY